MVSILLFSVEKCWRAIGPGNDEGPKKMDEGGDE